MLLSIDTSFGKFSIALNDGDKEIGYFESDEYTKQAEMLVPEIENILRAGLEYKDLNKIACCVGPGSFTGLRIGIAAAKGLELALGIETIAGNKLRSSAFATNGGKIYLDAKRGEAYFQEFDSELKPLTEPLIEYEGEFAPCQMPSLLQEWHLQKYPHILQWNHYI